MREITRISVALFFAVLFFFEDTLAQSGLPPVTVHSEQSLQWADGSIDILNPLTARDMYATFENQGKRDILVEVTSDEGEVETRTFRPGHSSVEFFGNVEDIKVSCLTIATHSSRNRFYWWNKRRCELKYSLLHANAEPSDGRGTLGNGGEVLDLPCIPSSGTIEASQACGFPENDIYNATNAPFLEYVVELNVRMIKGSALRVRTEADIPLQDEFVLIPGGTMQFEHKAYAGVKAVRVECIPRGDVGICSRCDFEYTFCYDWR